VALHFLWLKFNFVTCNQCIQGESIGKQVSIARLRFSNAASVSTPLSPAPMLDAPVPTQLLSLQMQDPTNCCVNALCNLTKLQATERVEVPGAHVIAVPFFERLDGKTTEDYEQRVEPSAQGSRKMADLIVTSLGFRFD
jgi:hypothetical protein